ncbi:MAG TPA: hypothetical protein VF746_24320 [Longimicrobium sp.]|jgi:hypothetical protein
MRIHRLVPALLALVPTLAACGRESPEKRAARRDAHRTACIAEELALQAKERLAYMDTALARSRGTAVEAISAASFRFAFAMKDYADAALKTVAYQDSALAARSREDSVRYAGLATRSRPPAPAARSVEANAAQRYEEELAAAFGNPAHPCNQEGEEGES